MTTLSLPYVELTETIAMVPVAHGVQAYADEVRRAVSVYQPDCIALELPRVLTPKFLELLGHLPEIRLLAWKYPGKQAEMLPADPCDSLVEGARLAQECGLRLELIDVAQGALEEGYVFLPDEFAISRIGLASYAEECLKVLTPSVPTRRETVMASRLAVLAESCGRILFVGGMGHLANIRSLLSNKHQKVDPQWEEEEPQTRILPVRERQLGKVLMEVPYAAYLYEMFRPAHGPEDRFPMLDALQHVLHRAALQYEQEYDERVNLSEWRAIYQYGRNLAVVRGNLRPHLYELLMCAKGCVDDDFGAIALEVAVSYPPNAEEEDPDAPQFEDKMEDDENDHGPQSHGCCHGSLHVYADMGEGTERLCHAYPHPELEELEFHFRRRRPSEAMKEAWRRRFADRVWSGDGICSWPPEDEFIERFFREIRKRAFQQVGEMHTTTEEFTTSILDGLDVRETMRHWHEKKLFVKRERLPPGRVGPVVLIWRDLPVETPWIWRTTLYAENQNESDLTIYAKKLGHEMVGPGITRTEYFGVLSVFPAAQIPDVWIFPHLRRWKTCARLLAACAVLLSEERFVAYVAKSPPDAELRAFAREHGKHMIYLPLGTFSRDLLKRARQCHILASKKAREWAGDYIPKV